MPGRFNKLIAPIRRWRAETPARRNGSRVTHCFYCGAAFTGTGRRQRTIDHRYPRSHGGGDGLDNVVFACRACNERKADQSEDEFVAEEDDPREIFLRLAFDDIREACAWMRRVWDGTEGQDGYVSLEVAPDLARANDLPLPMEFLGVSSRISPRELTEAVVGHQLAADALEASLP
jgi:antirestriction protein